MYTLNVYINMSMRSSFIGLCFISKLIYIIIYICNYLPRAINRVNSRTY